MGGRRLTHPASRGVLKHHLRFSADETRAIKTAPWLLRVRRCGIILFKTIPAGYFDWQSTGRNPTYYPGIFSGHILLQLCKQVRHSLWYCCPLAVGIQFIVAKVSENYQIYSLILIPRAKIGGNCYSLENLPEKLLAIP